MFEVCFPWWSDALWHVYVRINTNSDKFLMGRLQLWYPLKPDIHILWMLRKSVLNTLVSIAISLLLRMIIRITITTGSVLRQLFRRTPIDWSLASTSSFYGVKSFLSRLAVCQSADSFQFSFSSMGVYIANLFHYFNWHFKLGNADWLIAHYYVIFL